MNYFDVNYDAGWDWYLGHFPLRSLAALRTRRTGMAPVTFDASGYYCYHPHAARRLGADLPDVKVLLMVRDPVERAYSAYKHEYARRFETEDFLRALQLEDERVEPELARMDRDEGYASFTHRHHSYRRRGQYDEQLSRLREHLGPDRILTVDSQDFFSQPGGGVRAHPRLPRAGAPRTRRASTAGTPVRAPTCRRGRGGSSARRSHRTTKGSACSSAVPRAGPMK